jgi:hypothetical protein
VARQPWANGVLVDGDCKDREPMKERTVEVNRNRLEAILRRAEAKQLSDEDCETIKAVFESYARFVKLVAEKNMTMDRLWDLWPGVEQTDGMVGNGSGRKTRHEGASGGGV